MALIPSYLSWVPKTGTGNAQIKINSVNPYTGRTEAHVTFLHLVFFFRMLSAPLKPGKSCDSP